MTARSASESFLRNVLVADAIAVAGGGVLLAAGARVLSEPLGLSTDLLRTVGVALIPYAAILFWITTRPVISTRATQAVVVLNTIWVVASFWLLFSGRVELTTLGRIFVIAQASAVFTFALLEAIGLRNRGNA